MFLDVFTNLIKPHLEVLYLALAGAVLAIALLLAGLYVFRSGVARLLDMVKGHDSKPPKGYEYEFIDKNGRSEYSTWSKKDDYYHGKSRRRK